MPGSVCPKIRSAHPRLREADARVYVTGQMLVIDGGISVAL